ncbi:MAG: hypothetical protein QM793_00945 [Muricomes sp.]
MRSLEKEELVPLGKCVEELLQFVHGLHMEETPYFYRLVQNMKYNLEICFLVRYDGWEQMEQILKRDWKGANHMLLGIPKFDIQADTPKKKAELNCKFLDLITNIEHYLQLERE